MISTSYIPRFPLYIFSTDTENPQNSRRFPISGSTTYNWSEQKRSVRNIQNSNCFNWREWQLQG